MEIITTQKGGEALITYPWVLLPFFSMPVEESPETWFGGRIQGRFTAIRRFIQRSAAIAFVPLNFVRVSWNGLKAEMPDNEKLERYAAYFDEMWFDGHFRPCMWNYYRHCGPRTNNHLEGWHNRMKRISQKAHPNLYKVLELFQREQAASEVIILQPEAGGTCRQKGRKRIEREQKIQTLADELTNGDRDIDSYVSADTVLFPLILANMFHCYIPKIPNNKVYKYTYNVHCLIDTHLHLISTSLDILGLDILGLDILTIRHSGIRHSGNDSPELYHLCI